MIRFVQHCYKNSLNHQGDHSGCVKPPVDTKTKVAFKYRDRLKSWFVVW